MGCGETFEMRILGFNHAPNIVQIDKTKILSPTRSVDRIREHGTALKMFTSESIGILTFRKVT